MRRGTTPDIMIMLDGIEFAALKVMYITFKQDKNLITKTIQDVVYDEETKQISVHLTQEDTLSFHNGYVFVQIRALTNSDNAIATDIVRLNVDEILKEGVI